MTRFFIEGNVVFMSIISVLFLIVLIVSVLAGIKAFSSGSANPEKLSQLIRYIKSVALFTLVFGIFCQILGIVDVFNYLSDQEIDVASSVLAKGIKITFHPTIYGMAVFLFSIVITVGLRIKSKNVG